jgi:hypothetical protein
VSAFRRTFKERVRRSSALDQTASYLKLQSAPAGIVFCSTTMLPSSGMLPAASQGMADKSLDQRVALLERSMGDKTLEEHFRQHAELIDRRFAEMHARFTAQDKRFEAVDARFTSIDARFASIDARFVAIDGRFVAIDARFEAMDERFNRVDHELGLIRRDLGLILQKLT